MRGSRIGRIAGAGAITEFSIPTSKSGPAGINTGPDGRLWFTPATITVLRSWKARQAQERLLWGSDFSDLGLVFPMEDGRVMNPETLSDHFARAAKKAGLPSVRLHDLRHFHASALLLGGTPIHVVSRRLGHSKPSVTWDVYAHLLPKQDEAAATTAAALVDGSWVQGRSTTS